MASNTESTPAGRKTSIFQQTINEWLTHLEHRLWQPTSLPMQLAVKRAAKLSYPASSKDNYISCASHLIFGEKKQKRVNVG